MSVLPFLYFLLFRLAKSRSQIQLFAFLVKAQSLRFFLLNIRNITQCHKK